MVKEEWMQLQRKSELMESRSARDETFRQTIKSWTEKSTKDEKMWWEVVDKEDLNWLSGTKEIKEEKRGITALVIERQLFQTIVLEGIPEFAVTKDCRATQLLIQESQ